MTMEESPIDLIFKKIADYDYHSAKFRLALVKDGGFWKILIGRIILYIVEPKENKTWIKQNDFVLVDISVSIRKFEEFLTYLDKVNIEKVSSSGNVEINDELQYSLGGYELCFVGNFPSRQLTFYNRKTSKSAHGVDLPMYLADYMVHQSVAARKRPNLDLIETDLPFSSLSDVLNHYWGTNFEEHNIASYCHIFLPTFEASIADVLVENKKAKVAVSLDEKRIKLSDLSLGIIAQNQSQVFRDKKDLKTKNLDFDFRFEPTSIQVYLYLKGKKIDQFNHYDYTPIQVNRPSRRRQNRTDLYPAFEGYQEGPSLFESDLVSKLPEQIQSLLQEAEEAFQTGLFRATIILFRSAVEEGVTLILKQISKTSELYENKHEVGLGKKINLLIEYVPSFNQVKSELNDLKWFGDKATHEASMPVNASDITNNLEPKFRIILSKFSEEFGSFVKKN